MAIYTLSKLFRFDDPKSYEKHHSGKLEHHQQLIRYYEDAVEENNAKLKELDTALPSEQDFYELTRSKLLNLLNTEDIMVVDAICREFVTNLRAGNDSTSVIKLKPPYNLLVDLAEISTGRELANALELFDTIVHGVELYKNACDELSMLRNFKPDRPLVVTL